ncbi:hypothetical protein GCM10007962_10850 [Yeosuana aromativorans]|uniref:DUF4382 domain-containing protein n=2 Tax=Yeosuana aromativorans TaxID=288019 RepID=A0A8J3BJC9_9FLAO|nr:hypothetical protein GCM10007962_10850 [Yeosuana aromativorans]
MHYDQFMSASVTIDKIEIGNNADTNSMINIMNTPMTYNLLELINGITETMANTEIPVGNYDLMRLYVSSTEMVTKNGDTYTYNMNQDGYSGNGMMQGRMMLNSNNKSIDITLNNALTITEGGMSEFLLDMDVNQSFMLEGVNFTGSGSNMMMSMSGFTFMPTMRIVDMSTSGTIHGNVQDTVGNLPNATISLMHNGALYTTTHSDDNGNYTFIGIPQGMYTIEAELDGYIMNPVGNEQNMGEFNMMSNNTLNMNFIMMISN